MAEVEALGAIDPPAGEALKRGHHLGWIRDVPEGVGPDGDSAGAVDRVDGVLDGRDLPRTEAGTALDEIGAEKTRGIVEALGGQALGIGRVRGHRPGDV